MLAQVLLVFIERFHSSEPTRRRTRKTSNVDRWWGGGGGGSGVRLSPVQLGS